MLKITLTKNEMTDNEKKLDIIITEKSYDKLLNMLYPAYNRDSKGFITLAKFLFEEDK